MPEENAFKQFIYLANQLNEAGIDRPLLSAQLMPHLDRKPCAEIDIPMRDEKSSETNSQNSQIAKLRSNLSLDGKVKSLELSQEAINCINEQLTREAMQAFQEVFHRLCVPLSELSFAQIRLSEEAEQCVVSVARSLCVSLNDAFEICDRFLSRHGMSWKILAQFLTDGRIRRFDNELALVIQLPTPANPRFIGDATCEFNARSPHIRCAVNPCGPCEGCVHRGGKD